MKDELETKKLLSQIALIPQTMNAMLTFLKGKNASSNDTTTNPIEGTSRFVKAEDTTKVYQKKSIAKLSELVQVNKEILKKGFGNLAGGLGKLLMLGGLLGFLFTGKTEFLTSMVKGFEKVFILPIAKVIDKFIMKLSNSFLKYGASAAAKLGKIFKSLIPKVPKVPKILKEAKSVISGAAKATPEFIAKIGGKLNKAGKLINKAGKFTTIEKLVKEATETVAEELPSVAGKAVEKLGVKSLMKSGSKLGLKGLAKIPFLGIILGPILGIWFAIERYKKGDYIGALGELASGITTMIPGAGTFISLGIDALLLLRDFKSPEIKEKENKSTTGTISKAAVESLSFVSTVIHFQKMLKAKDAITAFKEGALAFGGMIPGFGAVESLVNYFHGNKNMATGEEVGKEVGGNSSGSWWKGASGGSSWSMMSKSPKLSPVGSSKWTDITETINPNTKKKQNKYKFNATWDSLIDKETKNSPISSDIIRSMIYQESGGDPNAESPPNKRGGTAKGLAQFMDATAQTWIKPWNGPQDSFDPEKAIPGMVHYMEYLYKNAGGKTDPNAVYKAMYDYHGHSTEADSVGAYSGGYVQKIASNLGENAPIGTVASSQKAHKGAAYQFGGNGAVVMNSQAIPQSTLTNNLNTINAQTKYQSNPETQELIKAVRNSSVEFKKSLSEISIKNSQTLKNDSAG